MIRVVAIDDDIESLENLKRLIQRYEQETGNFCTYKTFSNAIDFINEYQPIYDVVFLDIEMPHMDGLAAAKKLRQLDSEVCLIFFTNMAQYAINGYEVDALDFIVKPVKYFNFALKMNRVLKCIEMHSGDDILINVGDAVKRIKMRSVYYLEINNHSLIYHLTDGNYTVTGSLKDVEKHFLKAGFIKCNRCYLVNLNFITEVRQNCIKIGGDEIFISRRRKKEFMEELAKNGGLK